jgi:hypothetical protein
MQETIRLVVDFYILDLNQRRNKKKGVTFVPRLIVYI